MYIITTSAILRQPLLLVCLLLLLTRPALAVDTAALFEQSYPDVNQQVVNLADYRGKPLIVNFWASWCLPCREEIPALKAVWQSHHAKGLHIIGIGLEHDRPAVQDFVKRFRVQYPLLLATLDGVKLMMALGNEQGGLPYTMAINRKGEVIMRRLGKITHEELISAAQQLLEE